MKKALALVLALVLALSMAVSAFALTALVPASTTIKDGRIDVSENAISFVTDGKADTMVVNPVFEGETYYLLIEDTDLKNVDVTFTGDLEAKVVKYDPYTMKGADVNYYIADATEENENYHKYDAIVEKFGLELDKDKVAKTIAAYGENSVQHLDLVVEAANKIAKYPRFSVVADVEYYAVVLAVEENYTVAPKMGTFKITADKLNADKKTYTAVASDVITVYTDVTIFEYEEVKFAANNAKEELVIGSKGYSALLDSGNYGDKYVVEALRDVANATVVSTTAFRAIEGKDLTLVANSKFETLEVTLKEIAAGQKGVNFAYTIDGEYVDVNKDEKWEKGEVVTAIKFGFLGEQIIKGKFEIDVNLGIDYYALREYFALAVEEEDIITYYVVDEDNKVVKSIKVDYMVDDIDEDVEFTIAGENDTLGQYSIVLEVPASETETETEANPNTGAESVVGVVAALAVVSVATAAAVSLKK